MTTTYTLFVRKDTAATALGLHRQNLDLLLRTCLPSPQQTSVRTPDGRRKKMLSTDDLSKWLSRIGPAFFTPQLEVSLVDASIAIPPHDLLI